MDKTKNLKEELHLVKRQLRILQAEKQVRQTEDRFRSVLEDILLIGLMLDREGSIIFVNDFFLNLTGYKRDEVLTMNWFDLFIPREINADLKEVFQKTIEQDELVSNYTNEIVTKTGESRLIKWNNTTNYDKDNVPVSVTCLGEDITDLEKAHIALSESEAKFKAFFEVNPSSTFVWKLKNNKFYLQEMNRAAINLASEKVLEYSGMTASEIFPHMPDLIERMEECVSRRKLVVFEKLYKYRLKNTYDWLYFKLNYVSGGILLMFVEKITDRKKAENAFKSLATSYADLSGKRFYEAVCAHMAENMGLDYVYVGELSENNKKVSSIGGFELGKPMGELEYELKGTPCSDVIGGKICVYSDHVQDMFPDDKFLTDYGINGYIGSPLNNRDGMPLGILVGLSREPIEDSEAILQYFNIFIDKIISEIGRVGFEKLLVKAKEKAEESDRLKSAFLANMSHEIRTPMNGILGFTKLLEKSNLSGEKQKDYIKIIQKSGDRMLSTVNNIIEISKLEAGDISIDYSQVRVNDLINYLYNFFKPESNKKSIELKPEIQPDGEDLILKTDEGMLESILTNLLKNAIKFTAEGEVAFGYRIHSKKTGREIEFFVRDTGIGISGKMKDAIFKRFIQADIEDRQAYEGSGLGLSIASAYTEILKGTIEVESEEGKGSTFRVFLPMKE